MYIKGLEQIPSINIKIFIVKMLKDKAKVFKVSRTKKTILKGALKIPLRQLKCQILKYSLNAKESNNGRTEKHKDIKPSGGGGNMVNINTTIKCQCTKYPKEKTEMVKLDLKKDQTMCCYRTHTLNSEIQLD